MQRRDYVRLCLGAGTVGLAGCSDLIQTRDVTSTPPILDDRPDRVYYPTHVDGMAMVDMAKTDDGEYAFALMYTYPHRFWRVDATTTNAEEADLHDVDGSNDIHLMAVVWDPQTSRVLPDTGMSVDIARDGESLDEQVIYPMLSARMGFHYGANFKLDGEGTYDVTMSVGGTNVRRTGEYVGRFGDPASVTVPFEFTTEKRNELGIERAGDRAGEATVPSVMEMNHPLGIAPSPDELPGTNHGTAESDEAKLAVVSLSERPDGVDGEGSYLAVSARTPYNELVLPGMALDASIERDGETVFEGALERTFDDSLDYHYGAAVDDIQTGDELTLEVVTHPQVARHEGYETAFLQMPNAELTL